MNIKHEITVGQTVTDKLNGLMVVVTKIYHSFVVGLDENSKERFIDVKNIKS